MFQNLQLKLDRAIHRLKGYGKITEINVSETIKEIRRALIDADVHFKIAKDFTLRIKEKAIGQNVLTSLNPSQLMIKIIHDELTKLMGSNQVDINIKTNNITTILIVGLQGSGKTTFCAKLANYLKNKKFKKVLLVACDMYRPAAIEQLQVLANQIEVCVYSEVKNTPVSISKNAIEFAKNNNYDVIIFDTAGRTAIDNDMMNEIKEIHQVVNPSETLFIVDAMNGQDAINTTKIFYKILNFDGVVLTKLDGDTRGGVALTISYLINKPIKFISIGEKINALDVFYPNRMADRILGMGDIVSLVEKVQEQFNEEHLQKINKKIIKNQFGFDDFIAQIKQIKRMGDIKDLIGMIPGINLGIKNLNISDNAFVHIEAIIYSMTPIERRNPALLLNYSRKLRISKGSGRSLQEVNQLLKQFEQMSKIMKMIKKSKSKEMLYNIIKNIKL